MPALKLPRLHASVSILGHQDDRVENTGHGCRCDDGGEDHTVRRRMQIEQLCRRVRLVRDDRNVQDAVLCESVGRSDRQLTTYRPVRSYASRNVILPFVQKHDFLAHCTVSKRAPVVYIRFAQTESGSSQAVIFSATSGIVIRRSSSSVCVHMKAATSAPADVPLMTFAIHLVSSYSERLQNSAYEANLRQGELGLRQSASSGSQPLERY